MCPRGGGKERKRLYEEGLTAGAVTAATVVAMDEVRGTLSATRVYTTTTAAAVTAVNQGEGGVERVKEKGKCSQFWRTAV